MGHWEMQYGEIRLPSGQAPRLRAALNESVKAQIAEVEPFLAAAWAEVKKIPAAKRTFMGVENAVEQVVKASSSPIYQTGYSVYLGKNTRNTVPARTATYEEQRRIVEMVSNNLRVRYDSEKKRPVYSAPSVTRLRAALTGKSKYHKGTFWSLPSASIRLDGNTVHWQVDQERGSIADAELSPFYAVLFDFLDQVTWTARSGGTIYGNDEYSSESRGYEGAGGDYVVREYSKKAQAAQREQAMLARRSGYRPGYW